MRSVFVNSSPPKPEVILTNFFVEPTVLLVPITSRDTVETGVAHFLLEIEKNISSHTRDRVFKFCTLLLSIF